MSDLGVAELPLEEEALPLQPATAPLRNHLVEGPILRTLLRLAWPNVIALSAGVCVVVAETSYIGRLGVILAALIILSDDGGVAVSEETREAAGTSAWPRAWSGRRCRSPSSRWPRCSPPPG